VQYGAGSIPTSIDREEIDFAEVETSATAWLGHVFATLGVTSFKSKDMVVRAAPVSAALGALGRAFYTGDLDGQLTAKAVLQSGIDWSAGQHRSGIAGKVNPNGAFSVGSGEENGYATYHALTDSADPVTMRSATRSPPSKSHSTEVPARGPPVRWCLTSYRWVR
jgi:hypothetical protein